MSQSLAEQFGRRHAEPLDDARSGQQRPCRAIRSGASPKRKTVMDFEAGSITQTICTPAWRYSCDFPRSSSSVSFLLWISTTNSGIVSEVSFGRQAHRQRPFENKRCTGADDAIGIAAQDYTDLTEGFPRATGFGVLVENASDAVLHSSMITSRRCHRDNSPIIELIFHGTRRQFRGLRRLVRSGQKQRIKWRMLFDKDTGHKTFSSRIGGITFHFNNPNYARPPLTLPERFGFSYGLL